MESTRQPKSPLPLNVFCSYTHESDAHKAWVLRLARDLRLNGVDAHLDQWDCGPGQDVTQYMESGIVSADRVLLVSTPAYAKKANSAKGGVGYERLVVTSQLAERLDTDKFVCILRSGAPKQSIPVFAKARIHLDFTNDEEYQARFQELLRAIYRLPPDTRPPLGKNPFVGLSEPALYSDPTKVYDSIEKPPIGQVPLTDGVSHTNVIEKIIERIVERPLRRRLPETRHSITHEFDLAGHKGIITAGLYEEGNPAEICLTLFREGSMVSGLAHALAIAVSTALQYGVPIEALVRKFEGMRFEPAGPTQNEEIPTAQSLADYVFRWLAMEFVPGYRAANLPAHRRKSAPAPTIPDSE